MDESNLDQEYILGMLATRGPSTSAEMQHLLKKSQATVSRLLSSMGPDIVTLGSARAARYASPLSIHGSAFSQPLNWTDGSGATRQVGTLSLLEPDVVHIESDFGESTTRGRLPWFMSTLRAEGFLGRLLARHLMASVGPNPERWSVADTLFAALHLADAPGALTLGTPAATAHAPLPATGAALGSALEALAGDVTSTLPAGSSAGGEQPKFLTAAADGTHLLVKFAPPRGTPFGDRWHDMLHAEALANQVLSAHGVPVAANRVVEGPRRTFLLSERFDRIGPRGRRHVVSIGSVHEAFVPGRYDGWARTADVLARQRRLSRNDADRAAALLHFGRLIGNSDMHSGNLSLFVEPPGIRRGVFTLAPLYDMLPMRWRPDPVLGGAHDYMAFEPDEASVRSAAAVPARAFWDALSRRAEVGRDLRRVARTMVDRI